MDVPISGVCAPGFEHVREAFATNFAERGEVGAAVCVQVHGETVVDLVGGWANEARTHPWAHDTIVNFYSVGKAIVALLASRGENASICPSEAARALSGQNFRSVMDPVRAAAFRLAGRGVVRLTQGETELRLDVVPRGPFRVRRGPTFSR